MTVEYSERYYLADELASDPNATIEELRDCIRKLTDENRDLQDKVAYLDWVITRAGLAF